MNWTSKTIAVGISALAGILGVATTVTHAATWSGDVLQANHLYQSYGIDHTTDLGTLTVPGSVVDFILHIDVSASQITISSSDTAHFGASTNGFNGFELIDTSKDPHIIGVNLLSTNYFSPGVDFSSNRVAFNFNDQWVIGGGVATYDVIFADPTPLPPAAVLLGSVLLGGIGLANFRRRRHISIAGAVLHSH